MKYGPELTQFLRIFIPTFAEVAIRQSLAMLLLVYLFAKKKQTNFITGHPKATLLFWFFGYFRCGVWLFFFNVIKI